VKVITLGDSVAWGQGLLSSEKFDHLAGQAMALTVGAADAVVVENRAHSGATIAESGELAVDIALADWQEVPRSSPSIRSQSAEPDADADAVLLVGGLNDVNFRTILDPTRPDETQLETDVRTHMYDQMKPLLRDIRGAFPAAAVFVCGYYHILSPSSNIALIRTVATALTLGGGIPAAVATLGVGRRITRRARYFHSSQLYWLRRAVAEVREELGAGRPGVYFVHPAFGPQHSIGGNRALLFSPKPYDNPLVAVQAALQDPTTPALGLDPGDPMLQRRRTVCHAATEGLEEVTCRVAAIGHPNGEGAARYARAIGEEHAAAHHRSLRALLTETLGGGSLLSVRAALRRHGVARSGSVRDWTEHAQVDSVAVTVTTRARTGAGTDHAVRLRLGPGRSWQLDENVVDGDLTDDFEAGSVRRYQLDPANGSFQRRLRLAHVRELTLELHFEAGGILGGDWEPRLVELEINGRHVVAEQISAVLSVDALHQTDTWTSRRFPGN
jgi:lysophospholipase L1-like esterase